jgi:hypothetical protein
MHSLGGRTRNRVMNRNTGSAKKGEPEWLCCEKRLTAMVKRSTGRESFELQVFDVGGHGEIARQTNGHKGVLVPTASFPTPPESYFQAAAVCTFPRTCNTKCDVAKRVAHAKCYRFEFNDSSVHSAYAANQRPPALPRHVSNHPAKRRRTSSSGPTRFLALTRTRITFLKGRHILR